MPFIAMQPVLEDYWRAIILFGRNVASYKFALAQSLLELSAVERTFIPLDELAVPFARNLSGHLKNAPKQATSSSSRFLEAIRKFNQNEISESELVNQTVARGFENVIDAFHIVNRATVPTRFFVDERKERKGVTLTDELFRLKEHIQFQNLSPETEARWRLVETAWQLGLNPALLAVRYDEQASVFFVRDHRQTRIDVTSCRDALDGYQKGKCFYCSRNIALVPGSSEFADVDHFFPHTLLTRSSNDKNLNGVWNLVLACRECNRGERGKSSRIPALKYLNRLHTRNTYLIESHHPLRETLMLQTGVTEKMRERFLQEQYWAAKSALIHEWSAPDEIGTGL